MRIFDVKRYRHENLEGTSNCIWKDNLGRVFEDITIYEERLFAGFQQWSDFFLSIQIGLLQNNDLQKYW